MNLFIKIHVKIELLFMNIANLLKLLKFSWFLNKENIFRDGSPILILKVIGKFIELESSNYNNTIISNRSITESTELLLALIDEYFKTHSRVTLQQILEVLKVEFIERR